MLREAQAELGFELQLVEIDGNAELESRYRERIPVVEIDGEPVFTYFVEPDALRKRLAVPSTGEGRPLAES